MECQICRTEWKNFKSLTNHIRNTHKITSKEYYDKFLKRPGEEYCFNSSCWNEVESRLNYTSFLGIWFGYNKCCSIECKVRYIKLNGLRKYVKVNTSKLCDYGCGRVAKYRLLNKKYCCSDRLERCPESRKSISNRFKNMNRVPKGQVFNNYEGKLCDYGCGRIAKFVFKNGKCCCSENPSGCKKRKETMSKWLYYYYQDPQFLEKIKRGQNRRPNKPEMFLTKLLDNILPEKYKYTGNFQVFIGGKNPDFLYEDKKLIIEHFGTYYHSEEQIGKPKELHEEERVQHFRKFGYETLIIWENELENVNLLIKRILNFNERG